MLRIAVITGSTRPGRRSESVARWVLGHAQGRDAGASFELIDLAEQRLPLLDEPLPPAYGRYEQPHTHAWAETIEAFDAFIFVTPEYNRSVPGVLKNAIDFLYREWHNKAAGFVTYGMDAGGARASEHLRQIMSELQVAGVRRTVALSLKGDFDDTTFTPLPHRAAELDLLLDQLVAWGDALQTVR